MHLVLGPLQLTLLYASSMSHLNAAQVQAQVSPAVVQESISSQLWKLVEKSGLPTSLQHYRNLRSQEPERFRTMPWDQELNNFGYKLDGAGRYTEAIEIFRMNVENYPNHWGPHDSLAEAYMHAGQREQAIEHYRKSVQLNPKNLDGTRFLFMLEHYEKQTVRIPMRDGNKLFTQIYAPRDRSGKHPVMFYRTPYGNAPYNESTLRTGFGMSWKMVEAGTIFVFQDVRGTFLSEGTFVQMRPLRNASNETGIDESTDAYDSIEWLLKHVPHHNGRVGMRGNSLPGMYALMAALSGHPALVAVSPQAPPIDWFKGDDMHTNGALNLLMAVNWLRTNGVVRTNPSDQERPSILEYPSPDLYTFFRETGPLSAWNEKYFKNRVPFWNDLMTHGTYDEFWKQRNVLPHLNNLHAAVLFVGGWFDAEDPYGPVAAYQELQKNQPKVKSSLVMGPWYHGGWTRYDGDRLGEVKTNSNEASAHFRANVELAFFNHHLREKAPLNLPKALIYDTGTCQWLSLPAWPPKEAIPTPFYFQGNGRLQTTPPGGKAGFDEFQSDPHKPIPFSPRIEPEWGYRFMTSDQRFASSRPDVLTYTSEPFSEDITLVGPVGADLIVSTTGTDADWVVKVIDVYPDDEPNFPKQSDATQMGGYQALVRQGIMRGKFRNSLESPEPFVPGKATRVAFDLPDVCHTVRKGHRLMVQIQSTCFPLYDLNPQRFMDISSARLEDFQKTIHRVYRSSDQASIIQVRSMRREN
jgi:putative CocE/NonD family hydrolase